jgi:FkbM family methyltransferase
MNNILHLFDRRGWRWLLIPLITTMYFLKGAGWVVVRYHPAWRAWGFRIKGIVYLSPGPGWAYSYGYLNQLLLETYCKFITPKPGDCIVDLGAGLGEETVIFAQLVGKQGCVHAIEANPITVTALRYLQKSNAFDQVTVHHLAIAEEAGTVTIENNEASYVGNTIGKSSNDRQQFNVEAMPFDLFVDQQQIQRIDLLKSNIEGAEQFLIVGMSRHLAKVRVAAISCHDFRHNYHNDGEFYVTKDKVINFFTQHNFEILLNTTGHPVNDDIVYAINRKSPI